MSSSYVRWYTSTSNCSTCEFANVVLYTYFYISSCLLMNKIHCRQCCAAYLCFGCVTSVIPATSCQLLCCRYNRASLIPQSLCNCVSMDEFNVEGNNISQLPVNAQLSAHSSFSLLESTLCTISERLFQARNLTQSDCNSETAQLCCNGIVSVCLSPLRMRSSCSKRWP